MSVFKHSYGMHEMAALIAVISNCIVTMDITVVIFTIITPIVASQNITIGVILPKDGQYLWNLQDVLPAIHYATEGADVRGLLPTFNVSVDVRNSQCSETYAPLAAVDLFLNSKVNLFLGPVCDYAIAPVARFSGVWDVPVITAGAKVSNFDNKTEYKLLVRIEATFSYGAGFVLNILKHFGWKHVFFMHHDNRDQKNKGRSSCFFQLDAIYQTIVASFNVKPPYGKFDENVDSMEYLDSLIQRWKKEARIVVLCASADSVRNIMIKAHELNFDNGEYVFFNIDLFSSKNESAKPWYNESDTAERNEKARKAYEALMTVTLRKPISPEYKNFSREVKRRAKLNNENFTYGEEEVNSFVGAFHDAVLLYAIALNETLEDKGNITNGTEITRRMWNRTFKGITGNVSIDANGDRNADYSLLDMDPETGEFHVVANYFGNTKQYEPVPSRTIHWAGNYDKAPPDTPKCGFDGSKCPPEEPFSVLIIVSIVVPVTLVLAFLIVFIIVYRRMKFQAELDQMNWRVRWEDINLGSTEGDRKEKRRARAASNMSLARTDDSSVDGPLIQRSGSGSSNLTSWCRCFQCEEHVTLHQHVCCRQISKLEDRLEAGPCITSSKDFQDVVLNAQVLLAGFIHVMLVKKDRGTAPLTLSPYRLRVMAARQFLCWIHNGEVLERETKWAIPACVIRAIKLMFPDVGAEITSGDDAGSLTLEDILPLEDHTAV